MSKESEIDSIFSGLDTPAVETPIEETPTEVVEETPTEPIVEPPAEVAEEVADDEVPRETPASWRDKVKETPEYKEEKKVQDDETYKAKLKEIENYDSKLKEYREVTESQAYKFVENAIKSGKNPLQLLKESSVADPSSMKPLDLFMKKLEKYGTSLSEEDREAEIAIFEGKSKLEQIEATEGIKAILAKDHEEFLNQFEPKKAEPTPIDPALQAKVQKFEKEFDKALADLYGKKVNGVEFTAGVLDKIEKTIASGKISPDLFINEQGEFDPYEAIELVVFKQYRKAYIGGLRDIFKSEGVKEALKDKHNVGSGKAKTTGMPSKSSDAARKTAEINSMFPNQLN